MQAVPVESRKPKDTPFRQQRLKACQPILTPLIVISTFLAIGVVFFVLGFIMWHFDKNVVEVEVRYDNVCPQDATNFAAPVPPPVSNPCLVQFVVPQFIPAPAYFYYKLTNFYQNHRRYVSSLSEPQLAGKGTGDVSTCNPLGYTSVVNSNNATIPALINPCGLIADSWFIDEYPSLDNTLTGPIAWQRSGISWESDRTKFKLMTAEYVASNPNAVGVVPPMLKGIVNTTQPAPFPPQFPTTNEDFINWNRVAGLPTFRKLYAIIPGGVPPGQYSVNVNNRYFTTRFGNGQKFFVISSTSFIGGKNGFLGYAYIAVGSVCFALALAFFIVNFFKPRKLGDPELLSWNRGK